MTYYLVLSHKCIKLTGKYVISAQIISKNIILQNYIKPTYRKLIIMESTVPGATDATTLKHFINFRK